MAGESFSDGESRLDMAKPVGMPWGRRPWQKIN